VTTFRIQNSIYHRMTIEEYIFNIRKRYQTGISREHAYRGDLQQLLETLLPDTIVTNEPARISCGSPDYVITRKDIPIGYIEAKDIGVDLGKTLKSEQIKRYTASLDNLILTDYVTFIFLKDGEVYETLELFNLHVDRQIVNGVDKTEQRYKRFELLINDFSTHITQTIKSPTKLASMMANKAKLLAQVINNALTSDVESNANSSLKEQMEAFKQILIHDIKPAEFADIYAQTIAYGMFAARLHDPTPDTFSRQEAASLIPKSNPFLRKLFQYISGYDIDDRIEWIVSALADIFRATDVAEILNDFGKATQMNDPFIHFYEFFLAEYDPKLRKARGVWYTPEPVVNFIVRAVDDILKSEFGLPKGLADNSKTEIEVDTDVFDKKKQKYKKVKKQVHKVQILDPATGTGTFLAEVVKHIYGTKFKNMQGAWPQYVENDLIPRLNGFEILMASYAMAHLKLDLLLGETGYKATSDQRFKIYLTNSLEEANPDTGTLFANWLSSEASEANAVKRDNPVMCVIGNPPYSVSSSNKSKWIENLMKDYKKDLNERNIQPLSDDYLKFIRYGQYFIDKNKSGVLAYISNNSFLESAIHRQMRKNLMESFNDIYILNLHGNSRIKESTPDGSKDENVFDIMAGVSINIFVKNDNKKNSVKIYDLYGKRKVKYSKLIDATIDNIKWKQITPEAPNYKFKEVDNTLREPYLKGTSIKDIFLNKNSGLATEFDEYVIWENEKDAYQALDDLHSKEPAEILLKYKIKDKKLNKINQAIEDVKTNEARVVPIQYRPFDTRYCIYTGKSNGVMGRPRHSTMQHLLNGGNYGMIVSRTVYSNEGWYDVQITDKITEKGIMAMRVGNAAVVCPMYQQVTNEIALDNSRFISNISDKYAKHIEKTLMSSNISHEDIFDYVYGVLHSKVFRKKYEQFLKSDFPRIPQPKNLSEFKKIKKLGSQIREVHLLQTDLTTLLNVPYPEQGDNIITRKMIKASSGFELTNTETATGKVWINDDQYFDNVSELAWNFYIGGYQPAQKWLKDRQGHTLTYDDIEHYQKIIAALVETDKIMHEIDEVGVV